MDSKVFPATPQQALAMLYVQLHATAEDTPEQLWAMYKQAYDRVVKESQISRQ